MAKIIKIDNDVIFIGTDNGDFQEVRRSDCNFEPSVGDNVEVFASDTKTIVTKVVKEEKPAPKQEMPYNYPPQGININLQNAQSTPAGMPVANYQNVYGKTVVNKIVYCILAFCMGGIGIHKFYAGRIAAGIIYLLFCWTWIPSIIAFIEFIIALCQPSDANGNILV